MWRPQQENQGFTMKPCGKRDKEGKVEEGREDVKSSSKVLAPRMLNVHRAVLQILKKFSSKISVSHLRVSHELQDWLAHLIVHCTGVVVLHQGLLMCTASLSP